MKAHRMLGPIAVLVLAGSLSGCATLFHKGHNLRITEEENGRSVGKLAINLDHASPDLQVFEGERPLQIAQVQDHIASDAFKNSMRQFGAQHSCTAPCTYRWTETTRFGPGLFLDPTRQHTLRLVQGGRETTVTVHSHISYKWFWFDAFLGPLAPVAWLVDIGTKNWKEFPRLDVAQLFATPAAVTR